eukprot:TRINITY_DN387_c0_g1_i3.p1 TRINITY_DN387_c0_g1~~TRINITY_DN387_c0_g1_i3.p1  ORF type:complete len:364 (-),score=43.02 TRINITY_DN387_c0_g1_i3:342-1433(-)
MCIRDRPPIVKCVLCVNFSLDLLYIAISHNFTANITEHHADKYSFPHHVHNMKSQSKPKQLLHPPLKNITNRAQKLKMVKGAVGVKKMVPAVPCAKSSKKCFTSNRCKQPAQNQPKPKLNLKPNRPKIVQSKEKKPLRIDKKKITISKPKTKPVIILKPTIPLQSRLTKKVIVEYGSDIEADINTNFALSSAANCLQRHDIPQLLRAKMVDWMIEVTNIFELQHQTFFLAVMLMDLFYANTRDWFNSKDVHLTGMVSMFVASKYVDYVCIKMKELVNDVGHGEFSVDEVKAKEREMMRTLGFVIMFPTVFTFLEYLLQMFIFKNPKLNTKQVKIYAKVKKLSIFFGKMALYEYKLLKYRYALM